MTDCQLTSLSWCQAIIMACGQFFFLLEIFFRQPSLTRTGLLLLLLGLASTVPLWSESQPSRPRILISLHRSWHVVEVLLWRPWIKFLFTSGRLLELKLKYRQISRLEPLLFLQSSSWVWVGPISDPLLFRKCGGAGNWTRDLWICSRNHRQY
jgi:hypothetical protein